MPDNLKALASPKLDEEQLRQYALDAWQEADDAFRPIQSTLDDNWALYNNQFDFSQKAKWQSKNFVPKAKMAVRVMSSMIKRAMLDAGAFFEVEALNDEAKGMEGNVRDTIFKVLQQAGFENSFVEGLTAGLLEQLSVFKIYPLPMTTRDRPIHPDQTYKIAIVPISLYWVRLDPRRRNRYLLHKVTMDLADFRKLVDQGVYRKKSLEAVEADFGEKIEKYEESVRMGQADAAKPPWRKEVELLEFWGDIDSVDGKRLYENVTFTIVNEKAIARMPTKNPFRHGRPPFVYGPIIKKPFSVYHEGFLDGGRGVARMLNESLNLTLDASLFASAKGFEANLDFIHNPTQLKSGFYPGKVITTRGVPPGSQAIREFSLGTLPDTSIAVAQMLDREFQNATGVNEFIGGYPGTGEKTATEVRQKGAQSMSLTQEVASDVEQRQLAPIIEMVYDLIVEWNPEILGSEVRSIPADMLRFAFRVNGLSRMIQREGEVQKVLMTLNTVGKTPLAQSLNWKFLGDKIAEANHWDPQKLWQMSTTTPQDQQAEQVKDEATQQQLLQMLPQMTKMAGGAQGGGAK